MLSSASQQTGYCFFGCFFRDLFRRFSPVQKPSSPLCLFVFCWFSSLLWSFFSVLVLRLFFTRFGRLLQRSSLWEKMGDSSASLPYFGFGLNDKNFSDQILHIEITLEDSSPPNINKVKTANISSIVFAGNSPFFRKLMMESQQRDVTVKINSTQESAFDDVVHFMYNNTLCATTPSDLLGVLSIADKYEVTCCLKYCVKQLLGIPMSLELAFSYLELPSTILASEVVQPLIEASEKHLSTTYDKDFRKFQEEAMEFPLCVIEAFFQTQGLKVESEDIIFEFTLKWVRAHYPALEDRQEILTKRLSRYICFPNMSPSKLREVLACPDFYHEQVTKLVVEALFSKVDLSCGQLMSSSDNGSVYLYMDRATLIEVSTYYDFLGRVYLPHCVVYFELKKENLARSRQIVCYTFSLGGDELVLQAECTQLSDSDQLFGLHLRLHTHGSDAVPPLGVELAVLNKSLKEFETKLKANDVTLHTRSASVGEIQIEMPSMGADYFVKDILRFRVKLQIKPSV